MCSVSDDLDCLSLSSSVSGYESLINAGCKKCRSQPAEIVLQLKDAFCRNCLLLYVNHKFRACLGKSKLIRPKEKILVGVSGSMGCSTLLDLIYCGLKDTTPKRLMFCPVLIFIDDGAALNISDEKRVEIFEEMKLLLMERGLPAFYVPLESILNFKSSDVLSIDGTVSVEIDGIAACKVRKMFQDIKSLTSKEDLLVKLRQTLLTRIAQVLECSKILTAETGTDLAVKLISNVVIGRGAHLSLDVGFCDSRCSPILLLRPLQDLNKKAVAFYVFFKKLKTVFIPSFSSMEGPKNSLHKLTENFLVSLQSEFPSTMSTIFRTGEKLSLNPLSQSSEIQICKLCQGPLDISFNEPSAFQATQISSVISKHGKAAIDSEGMFVDRAKTEVLLTDPCSKEPKENTLGSNSKAAFEYNIDDCCRTTCYGCQLTLKEVQSSEDVLKNVMLRNFSGSNQLDLEDVREFLLE